MAILAIPGLIALVPHASGGAILSTSAGGYVAGTLIPASVVGAAPAIGAVLVTAAAVAAGTYLYIHGVPSVLASALVNKGVATTVTTATAQQAAAGTAAAAAATTAAPTATAAAAAVASTAAPSAAVAAATTATTAAATAATTAAASTTVTAKAVAVATPASTVIAVPLASAVLVLAALAAVGYVAYTHSETVKETVDGLASKAQAATATQLEELKLSELIEDLKASLARLVEATKEFASDAAAWMEEAASSVSQSVALLADKAMDQVSLKIEHSKEAISQAAKKFS